MAFAILLAFPQYSFPERHGIGGCFAAAAHDGEGAHEPGVVGAEQPIEGVESGRVRRHVHRDGEIHSKSHDRRLAKVWPACPRRYGWVSPAIIPQIAAKPSGHAGRVTPRRARTSGRLE